MTLLISVLEQGMIYAIMALGIYITYKILDFPDLTVDGSFPMGAAIAAVLISKDFNPVLTPRRSASWQEQWWNPYRSHPRKTARSEIFFPASS